MTPHASSWSRPQTVAGFAQSPPNARLLRVAADELRRLGGRGRALDIGCGAARNAVPLARLGWETVGVDSSGPMLTAAVERRDTEASSSRLWVAYADMGALPVRDAWADLIVAHGIWNLARSGSAFRAAVADAARVAKPGALLFVFTFSRHTLPPESAPVRGESFVFTEFSGEPQCFLTEAQLVSELAPWFTPAPEVTLAEHNLPLTGALRSGAPVIFEGGFRAHDSRR